MCDSSTLSVIEDVVSSKTSNNELFTAFDVTLAVQKQLKQRQAFDQNQHRHRHLKDDVHRIVDSHVNNGLYSRNLQNVGAPTDAYVYYPVGGDPSSYVPLSRNDAPTVASSNPFVIPVATPVALPAPPVTPVADAQQVVLDVIPDSIDGRTPDARGTLCVPNVYIKKIGLKAFETAIVCVDEINGKACLVISKDAPQGKASSAVYTVDTYFNVRVNKSVLDYAGLASAVAYKFTADDLNVYIYDSANSN